MAALLLAVALLTGCGAQEGVRPEQDAEERYLIHLTGENTFEPGTARVPVGATVRWVVDAGMHDVNAEDESFSSTEVHGRDAEGYPIKIGPGDVFDHTFMEKGRFDYWCHTHHEEGMKGTLIVA